MVESTAAGTAAESVETPGSCRVIQENVLDVVKTRFHESLRWASSWACSGLTDTVAGTRTPGQLERKVVSSYP